MQSHSLRVKLHDEAIYPLSKESAVERNNCRYCSMRLSITTEDSHMLVVAEAVPKFPRCAPVSSATRVAVLLRAGIVPQAIERWSKELPFLVLPRDRTSQ